jgi:hypothetical protein
MAIDPGGPNDDVLGQFVFATQAVDDLVSKYEAPDFQSRRDTLYQSYIQAVQLGDDQGEPQREATAVAMSKLLDDFNTEITSSSNSTDNGGQPHPQGDLQPAASGMSAVDYEAARAIVAGFLLAAAVGGASASPNISLIQTTYDNAVKGHNSTDPATVKVADSIMAQLGARLGNAYQDIATPAGFADLAGQAAKDVRNQLPSLPSIAGFGLTAILFIAILIYIFFFAKGKAAAAAAA